MGVPSPLLSTACRKASASRLETPELPLLEAASELLHAQAFDLLPSSVLDARASDEEVDDSFECAKYETSMPATCTESRASSPESETTLNSPGAGTRSPTCHDVPSFEDTAPIVEKNTFLETVDMSDSCESVVDHPQLRRRSYTELSGLSDLKARGVHNVPKERLASGYPFQISTCVEASKASAKQADGSYVALWCRMQQLEGGTFVFPCPDMPTYSDDVYRDYGPYVGYGEDPSVSFEALWCWQQYGPDGLYIVPYTTIEEKANCEGTPSTAEALCAPAAPDDDAYVPEWNFGPCWPFNVTPTTLILRNLPAELSQETLIEFLDREDLSGFYDFVFMPLDLSTGLNRGYAFVNLSKHSYGLTLAARFHGRKQWCVGYETTACEVIWSHEGQGLDFLLERFRNAEENFDEVSEEFRPQLFRDGWPAAYPRPNLMAPCCM